MDVSPEDWTHTSFKKFFASSYKGWFKVGGAIPWTLKETTLLSRMMQEFSRQDLQDMIAHWMENTSKPAIACQFSNFYNKRIELYHEMKATNEPYSWE